MMMKPIHSVSIKFSDGTTRDIIVDAGEGYYKEERLPGDLLDHSVYIVNGLVRDTPKIGFE